MNIVQFTKEFNARTADQGDLVIPVVITVYADRSFSFITKTPPAAVLLKKACKIKSGSATPNKTKVATISRAEVQKIAELKMPDLNAASIEAATSTVSYTHLDELQVQAVIEAVNCGLLIITGGPGTGKTTTINIIIRYFEMGEMEILLAAPTGRAAKRMTEATGYEARTIHRLLELSGGPGLDEKGQGGTSAGMRFERNEENPLDADVVIIDEMSMVDIHLMHSLLKAVNVGTRLILVGDVNQLPSVGPGNVLRDMIDSGQFHVVRLTRIFRQAAQSDIIVNAHKINDGEQVPVGKKSNDFLFIRREDPNAIINACLLYTSRCV